MDKIYGLMFKAGFESSDWHRHKFMLQPFLDKVVENKGYLTPDEHILSFATTFEKFDYLLKNNIPINSKINNKLILNDFFISTYAFPNQNNQSKIRDKILELLELNNNQKLNLEFLNFEKISSAKKNDNLFKFMIRSHDYNSLTKSLKLIDRKEFNSEFVHDLLEVAYYLKERGTEMSNFILKEIQKHQIISSEMAYDIIQTPHKLLSGQNSLTFNIISHLNRNNLLNPEQEKNLIKQGLKSLNQIFYDQEFDDSLSGEFKDGIFGTFKLDHIRDFCIGITQSLSALSKMGYFPHPKEDEIKSSIKKCMKYYNDNKTKNLKINPELLDKELLFLSIQVSDKLNEKKNIRKML